MSKLSLLLMIVSVLACTAKTTGLVEEKDFQLQVGAGSDLVTSRCATCHSLDYLTMNSPFQDEPAWAITIHKMKEVMGATVREEEIPQISSYLSKYYGREF